MKKCSIENCTNSCYSKGVFKADGSPKMSNTCRRHRADGTLR